MAVKAPAAFNGVELPRILASSTEEALNRKVTVSLSDMTGDLRQVQIFIRFKITEILGGVARTRFDQLELAREFVRGMSRRGTTKTEIMADVSTSDGGILRIFIVAVSRGKIHRSKRTAMRHIGYDIMQKHASENTFNKFIQDIVLGKVAAEVYSAARKIANINTLEIRKVKVLSPPLGADTEQIPEQAPEEKASASVGQESVDNQK
ncbi:MAG: hypothetical protein M1357_01115 [Candidatus Marsarchaeota archaeon]|nr:hypothetical protein [Candidatus Marsarchaeota archaeon]